MMLGLGLSISQVQRASAPIFDPGTLALSGWWRAYGGAPWAGAASAGNSGSHSLTAGVAPATGTAVNGKTPASFNGSSHFLQGDNLEDLFTVTAYTVVVLVKPTAAIAAAGGVYDNKQIVANGGGFGQFGMAWSTSGVKAWHDINGGTKKETGWLACPSDAYAVLTQTFDGSTLGISLNNGTPTTVASVGNMSITGLGAMPLRVGINYGATYGQEDVLEIITAPSTLSGANLTSIYSYLKATYPAAGLP